MRVHKQLITQLQMGSLLKWKQKPMKDHVGFFFNYYYLFRADVKHERCSAWSFVLLLIMHLLSGCRSQACVGMPTYVSINLCIFPIACENKL